MINKIRDIVSTNKLYAWMVIFILLMQAAVALSHMEASTPKAEEGLSAEAFRQDIEQKQEALRELLLKDYQLARLTSLIFLFGLAIIVTGTVLLVDYISRVRAGNEVIDKTFDQIEPLWSISDVVRIIIIFVFYSYFFSACSLLLRLFCSFRGLDRRAAIVASTGFMDILIFMFILRFVIVRYKQSVAALGVSIKNFLKNIKIAVYTYVCFLPILAVIFFMVLLVAKMLNYSPPPEPIYELVFKEQRPLLLIIISALITMLGPIIEEVFFRGFLYGALRRRLNIFYSILISALFFSLLHTNLLGFLPIVSLGILLAYVREKTGSLVPSMAIHIMHNTAVASMMFFARSLLSRAA